jgi:peptide/nickel transport system substrate-binding protein
VQGAIPRGFDVPGPPDCQSDVRRSAFLPKQKSQSPSIFRIVDSQTLTSGGFGVPSYRSTSQRCRPAAR